MTVTISDVRILLNNIASDLVSDEVIQKNINLVSDYIDAIKDSDADSTLVEQAKLFGAAYQTLLSYSTSVERVGGGTLASALTQASELKTRYEDLVKRISGQSTGLVVTDTIKSLTEDLYYS